MITFTDKGIYCKQGNFYIDPWKPVEKALITHAHSDHARYGSKQYLCHKFTVPVLRLRLGEIDVQAIEYGEKLYINNVQVSFHPAGHIIGSAQIRLEYKGEVWVISGDYKLSNDLLSTPYECIKCHHFITESTFGLPIYQFQNPQFIYNDINHWWRTNASEGYNTIVLGYALGKSQTILHSLDKSVGNIYLHGAVANINDSLGRVGFHFPGKRVSEENNKLKIERAFISAPPSALNTTWLKKFQPYRIAMCSGWMALRGARRRYGVDKGFVLSDHCDWQQLNDAVAGTGAEDIYVTHGYETPFVKWLKEKFGLRAHEVKTFYSNEESGEDL
ncbi:MAG: ligase-associated DNA damage response exonuclease [Arachidicoccus sp.]|nr:ligase-associated DNA damage response exonuclease [Arachidicoccus sp.]